MKVNPFPDKKTQMPKQVTKMSEVGQEQSGAHAPVEGASNLVSV